MLQYLQQLWETSSLSPHGICLLWRPELIWTHVGADALIGIAYYSIPVALAYFVSHRNDIAFGWVFWAFALFILACGTTHFFSIWTLWVPDYGTEALIKAVTAALSVVTAIGLWPLLPKALAIPSIDALQRVNAELKQQIDERNAALAALQAEKVERLKTEDMLRQAQKMEAVGQLTGGIAHDFNNLLTIVAGNLERLEVRFRDDPAAHRSIKSALEGASRGAALTQKLLAFSRRQPLTTKRLDANALIDGMSGLLPRAIGENIAIDLRLGSGLWPIEVDPNQLENALINLAVNARDAMPDGGRLSIESRNCIDPLLGESETLKGHFALLTVSDNGFGMTPDVLSHAFEPFFTTKPVGEGSGLGLSQVYGFVTQSNGRIEIVSEPDRGTSVRIYLPRAPAETEQTAAGATISLAAAAAGQIG
ncbi:MAG: ATPase [Rhizobiales bacterium]|nr:ATPase [Hyphomicrobiales bacterium]